MRDTMDRQGASLEDLPAPAAGRAGWPWTTSVKPCETTLPDGAPWPRISVITPSFNQGTYLEETLRSVLLQGYPNLEYIVMDGGSTDDSVETIRRYEPWLSYWISTRDGGQPHALNQGFDRASGTLLGSINSDDLLEPGALRLLGLAHHAKPAAILLGDVINFDEETGMSWCVRQQNVNFDAMSQPCCHAVTWHQPGTWFPHAVFQRIGPFDESLRYLFDWDWMCRALPVAPAHHVAGAVARFRYHGRSKTVGESSSWRHEKVILIRRYWPRRVGDDPTLSLAVLEFVVSTDKMVYQSFARREAIAHLWRALRYDARVLAWSRYWVAWCKALLPESVLQFSRMLMRGF